MKRDPDVEWSPASPTAILFDAEANAWGAGHVNAILVLPPGSEFPGALLAGAETGGVWLIQQPDDFDTSPAARCLTDDWDDPNVNSLAYGPLGPNHVYAGTSTGLRETDTTQDFPLESEWRDISPSNSGQVMAIAVLDSVRQIVLATTSGVYWSSIPAAGGTYVWTKIKQAGFAVGAFSGAAVGPDNSVFVAVWKTQAGSPNAIYQGAWSKGALVMQPSTITGLDPTQMMRVSLASCASDPSILYAFAGAPDDTMLGLLAYDSNRQTWNELNATIAGSAGQIAVQSQAGHQQAWNNCIAVAPANPTTVAFGFSSGTFISTDGGGTWALYSFPNSQVGTPSVHLHSDVHAVHFDPQDSAGKTLYIGSDGGVAGTQDLGATFVSLYNQYLLNLQFYGSAVTVSPVQPGLLAGGSQDNGNLYCIFGRFPQTYTWLDGGDGGINLFIASGQLLSDWNTHSTFVATPWIAPTATSVGQFGGYAEIQMPKPGNSSIGDAYQKTLTESGGVLTPVDTDLQQPGNSAVAGVPRATGQFDIAMRTPYGEATLHLSWDGQNWNPDPTKGYWDNMGGVAISPPELVSVSPSLLAVFVRSTDLKAYCNFWDGQTWAGWTSLGGTVSSSLKAVSSGSKRIDLFARGSGGELDHKWWDGTNWNPTATGWESLGGTLTSAPEAICDSAANIHLFVRGPGNQLFYKRYDGTNWHPSKTGYDPLGGHCTSIASVASSGTGRIDVFARNDQMELIYKYYDGSWHPSQSTFHNLGGFMTSAPSAVSWGPGRLDIFWRGANTTLCHKSGDGTNWSPGLSTFDDLGDATISSRPRAVSAQANRLDVFFLKQQGPSLALCAAVMEPVFQDSLGLYMFAAAAQDADIYGLFGDVVGNNLQWDYLATLNPDSAAELLATTFVSAIAVAAGDGKAIFIGTASGAIFLLELPGTNLKALKVPAPAPVQISGIAALSATSAFAIAGTQILRFDGTAWTVLASAPAVESYSAVAIDPSSGVVYACTDGTLISSQDSGATWLDASLDLPKRGHFNALCVQQAATGNQLYLGTYGRGLYVTDLPSASATMPPVRQAPGMPNEPLPGRARRPPSIVRFGQTRQLDPAPVEESS